MPATSNARHLCCLEQSPEAPWHQLFRQRCALNTNHSPREEWMVNSETVQCVWHCSKR